MNGELFSCADAPVQIDHAHIARGMDAVQRYARHTGLTNQQAWDVLTLGGQVDPLLAAQERDADSQASLIEASL